MSKKTRTIITFLLICSFLFMTVQIVRAGTHSSHFTSSWWSFGNSWKYYYTQQGTTNYSNNITSAISSWQTATSKLSVSRATAP